MTTKQPAPPSPPSDAYRSAPPGRPPDRHGATEGGPPGPRWSSPPEIVQLRSVPGFIVFDLPDAPVSAGGTRLAPDVTQHEVTLLARAMTYKFAILGKRIGGAKAGLRGDPADHAARAGLMARYCAEIQPLAAARRFLTGPDIGTSEEDFAALGDRDAIPAAIRSGVPGGVAFEDILTGYGVATAAETALSARRAGGPRSRVPAWEGRSVAIEGFGKAGSGVAREIARRGGRAVAVSTVVGCVMDPSGLDVGRLLDLRRAYGDDCVARYGLPLSPAASLFTQASADVLVPGARPGVITRRVAELLPPAVGVVAPAANVPYTAAGADTLLRRGITALPDFVCNAGAVIGYSLPRHATPQQILSEVSARITELTRQALGDPAGPLAAAFEHAAAFLRSWRGEVPGPPLAPEK
jgi:glutamate dehydrogenase (NAD(P)+)